MQTRTWFSGGNLHIIFEAEKDGDKDVLLEMIEQGFVSSIGICAECAQKSGVGHCEDPRNVEIVLQRKHITTLRVWLLAVINWRLFISI